MGRTVQVRKIQRMNELYFILVTLYMTDHDVFTRYSTDILERLHHCDTHKPSYIVNNWGATDWL
jgi:hypothetical protein